MNKQALDKWFLRVLNTVLIGAIITFLSLLFAGIAQAAPNCERHMDDDQIALACNIYWEAHTEGYEGMLAVATVTMNRVASPRYPNTVSEVVWQRKQFSWTHDGLYDRPEYRPTWKQALQIASLFTITKHRKAILCPTATQINAAMLGWPDPGCEAYQTLVKNHTVIASLLDPTGGSLYYHADYVEPYWVDPRFLKVKIGAHIFYAQARI